MENTQKVKQIFFSPNPDCQGQISLKTVIKLMKSYIYLDIYLAIRFDS
jgi:hypothetical protein